VRSVAGAAVVGAGVLGRTAVGSAARSWELTLVSPRAARPRDYARAVELAGTPALRLAPLLTAVFALDDAPSAFDACRQPSQLKVALDIG
jgi:threonine dehydrogenase-like Zn-dependent dehydrogenase